MILSDREIWMEIGSQRLKFDPQIEPEQVGPSSVDLRLSTEFTILDAHQSPQIKGVENQTIVDIANVENPEAVFEAYGEKKNVPLGGCFMFEPGKLVLAFTYETVELPNYLAARVEGRSSLARYGISIHQTAPTVHATFKGQLRLEMSNNGPFCCKLRPGKTICQLVLERLGSPSSISLISAFQGQQQTKPNTPKLN